MELYSRKKNGRNRMMRSESFVTQEVRMLGQKKTGDLIDFPMLWMGITEDVFQIDRKE